MRVAVVGCGAIGGTVARAILGGEVAGVDLVGVVHNAGADPVGLPVLGIADAVREADLVVECAGQDALAEIAPPVLEAGKDLLVVSVGALADDAVFAAVTCSRAGRVYLSTGAIGGLDVLSAAARMGPLSDVRITTTKAARSLVQPWMSEPEATRLRQTLEPVELLRGPARKVTAEFPTSANVAASVAVACGSWDLVEAVVVADPEARRTSHVITADGQAGSYRFEIANRPSEENPRSSGVVPFAVLRALDTLANAKVVFR